MVRRCLIPRITQYAFTISVFVQINLLQGKELVRVIEDLGHRIKHIPCVRKSDLWHID